MKRILSGFFLLFIFAAVMYFEGCSSPSSPDVPPQPYHVAAIYPLPGPAKDVAAMGDFAAVADGPYGLVVLNVRDLTHIDTVCRDTVSALAGVSRVGIDTTNHLVAMTTEPRETAGEANKVYDYRTGERVSSVPFFQGPYYGFMLEGARNDVSFSGTMHSRFQHSRMRRDSDSSAWAFPSNLIYNFADFVQSSQGVIQNRGQGFALLPAKGVVALTIEEAGIHFLDDTTLALASIQLIRGSAYDCAWYQDSLLVVAAEFQMVILNVSDVMHPYVTAEYEIPSSTHLRGVVIDGNWACLMDEFHGLSIVDLTIPRHPVFVQLLKLNAPTSIYVDNGRLYATDEASGLVIYTR